MRDGGVELPELAERVAEVVAHGRLARIGGDRPREAPPRPRQVPVREMAHAEPVEHQRVRGPELQRGTYASSRLGKAPGLLEQVAEVRPGLEERRAQRERAPVAGDGLVEAARAGEAQGPHEGILGVRAVQRDRPFDGGQGLGMAVLEHRRERQHVMGLGVARLAREHLPGARLRLEEAPAVDQLRRGAKLLRDGGGARAQFFFAGSGMYSKTFTTRVDAGGGAGDVDGRVALGLRDEAHEVHGGRLGDDLHVAGRELAVADHAGLHVGGDERIVAARGERGVAADGELVGHARHLRRWPSPLSSTAFFVSSSGTSPVRRTLRLKLVALTWSPGSLLVSFAITFHSMFSSST